MATPVRRDKTPVIGVSCDSDSGDAAEVDGCWSRDDQQGFRDRGRSARTRTVVVPRRQQGFRDGRPVR